MTSTNTLLSIALALLGVLYLSDPWASPDIRGDRTQPTGPGQAVGSGSGFHVSPDIVVTAEHVVEGCDFAIDSSGHLLTVLARDPEVDIAILRSGTRRENWLPILQDPPLLLGRKIYAIGFPYYNIAGTSIHLTSGNISSLADPDDDTRFFSISAAVQPGNSGGPVIDGDGYVAGMVVSRVSEKYIADMTGTLPQNMSYAIHRDEILRLLSSVQAVPEPRPPAFSLDDSGVSGDLLSGIIALSCDPNGETGPYADMANNTWH